MVRGPGGGPDLAHRLVQRHHRPRRCRGRLHVAAGSPAATSPSCTSPSPTGPAARCSTTTTAALRAAHPGPIVGAGNYDLGKAERLLRDGLVDAAAFGRSFIANPDLPRRLQEGLPLNVPQPETFYGGSEAGYTDYPAYGAA